MFKIKLACFYLFIYFAVSSSILYSQKQTNLPSTSNYSFNDSIVEIIDSLKEITPSIEFGTEYANKVVFWGRDFGEKQFGVEPYILFNTGKGFYLSAAQNYWSAMPYKFAKTDIGLGYEKQLTDRLYTSLEYERWIFYNGDEYVRNALVNSIEADVNYDLDWINIEPAFYFMFGYEHFFQTDIMIYGEYYMFSFLRAGRVYFKPQWITTFANQTFLPLYSDYPASYIKAKNFKLVDFELNAPILFKLKNFEVEPIFHYNIPVKAKNEDISSFYYFSIHLTYNFYFDKGKIKSLYKIL